MSSSVTALILAGGRATRFGGIAKHELVPDPRDGRTIFERQVAVLAPRVGEIVVSSPRSIAGHRTVVDAISDGGPLAGIAAGLAVATTEWVLVVAGDMPYLTAAVVDLVLGRIADSVDAVAFSIEGLPEPLFCALRRDPVRRALERMLATGQRKASRLLTDADLRVSWIDEIALREVDPALQSLANVNEPADLR